MWPKRGLINLGASFSTLELLVIKEYTLDSDSTVVCVLRNFNGNPIFEISGNLR